MRIQNRWIITVLFLILSILLLIGISIYNNIKTVDLSNTSINGLHLNDQFHKKNYKVNKNIKVDRYTFYNHKEHNDLTLKVHKKKNIVKGIVLVKDKDVPTNFDVKIGSHIDQAINSLGSNYQKNKIGKNYQSITYRDRDNHMKLNILYKDDIVKRIEFFSK
ncbi:hypothetical protein [Staphylococcus pasteuri]|uniref:hypothetical protein n=1 Tax=Staphylococcus pasteuri TaxID=45972 RepID=UPI000E36E483|nr:hypothetical protein [Staphylococcus pasteuri]RFD72011.1 hypothetical protein A7974_10520 [Staphylococcus pasteuri]